MAQLRLISADSHVMEPADFWQKRLDNKFRDRAPHVEARADGKGYFFTAPGISPFPVAGGFGTGRSGQELRDHMSKGYEAARPSGWDPVERIKDQQIDGVDAEVLYTTLGMPLFGLDDTDLQRACFHVYNEWLADFCAHNPKRLIGTALISLEDIALGVKELEHCAKRGLKGAMIWGSPPKDKPYSSTVYDPLWQAASECRMPLSLHVITGKGKDSDLSKVNDALTGGAGRVSMGEIYANLIHEVQQSLSSIIFGGVLERFPKLIIVSAENDVGWVPHYMYRLDHAWEKFNAIMPNPLPMKPSEYIRRQMFATFQDDPVGPAAYKLFGAANYMWASDFPHTDSTWPESHKVVERDFAGVPEEIRRKIVYDNAATLYGIAH
jgi:predicted TIM-barrel fold metal-dependent hydrolase